MTQSGASARAGSPQLVTLDGRYHIVDRIAAGGMGEVYRAHDAVLAREVAIKVLHRSLAADQGFVDRFRREARAAAGLNHPNIVSVYDWGAVDGIYYMVMEYVQGSSARALLNAQGRLEPAQAMEVVRQCLVALEHAHARGLVHRDLKPENILITPDGVVKLTDLGLARAYAEGTTSRSMIGTVQYLSPEQIRGEPADPRSDLYSLGIVAFELLTGILPFTGETPMSIAYKHLSERVPAPSATDSGLPAELDGFVASATDPDRELRPSSATEMRRDLESIQGSLPSARSLASVVEDQPEVVDDDERTGEIPESAVTTATIPRVERTKRRRWRKVLAVILAVAAVAAAAWGAWTYLIPHRHEVPALIGIPVEQAERQLHELGFVVRTGPARFDRSFARGEVIRTRPVPGTLLEEGATVTLVASLGPPLTEVPALVDKKLERAKQLLETARLKVGGIRRRWSFEVPAGKVIAAKPARGRLPEGSPVSMVVSRGAKPQVVPGVVGMKADAAETALTGRGFVVTRSDDFSDEIPEGRVIAVTPAEGTTQPYGSAASIVVSLGPERFPCPDFRGKSKNDAKALAEQRHLEVTFLQVPGTNGTTVFSQLPLPGVTVRYGQTITLYLA